jgi:hypothetical protein
MRNTAFIFIFSMIVACKKKEVLLTNEGVITGVNPCEYACVIECPCACGNFLFHFTDTGDTSNVIIDDHDAINLPSNTQFPVHITLDWQNTTRCNVKGIKILKYKLL